MFRSSLGRLARPAGAIKAAPVLSQARLPLRQISPRSYLAAVQYRISPRELYTIGLRSYSTESAAAVDSADTEGAAAGNAITTSFADLQKLGVHRNLTNAIISDMGYETMTPVQSLTINPALKGTDM